MTNILSTIMQAHHMPLADLIEPGPGFRIGGPDFQFEAVQRDERSWTSIDRAHELKVQTTLAVRGAALVIEHRLTNIGAAASPPIDVVEPLYLVFRQPLEAWRFITANGGTTESYYPPTAYRTNERTGERASHGPENPVLIESHPLGRSSNLHLPLLIALSSTAPGSDGLFCGLEWSATWYMAHGAPEEGKSSLAAGVKVAGMRLEPGETLTLPAVHLGTFSGGAAAGTNALRRYLYEHVCARYHGELMIPRANYSTWFGLYNNIDHGRLKAEADRAAELGLEVFAIDASWFPSNFPEGVGNWDRVDLEKFPDGLEPIAEHVRSLGMGLGMWFEPERGVEGTSAVEQHPDWFVPVPRAPWYKKQPYHLNLALPAAQDWVIETVGGWIERLGLVWSRWDYNIEPMPMWKAIDPTLKIQFAYMQGLYRVLDTLMADHPDWMVEGCASGGRRVDMGTMRRAHTFWFSDQSVDPLLCRYMQARANRFLPGHLCDSTVAVPLGAGDAGYDDTAVLSRMLGKLAIDGDVASWSPALTERVAGWVAQFKAIRHLLVQDFYQLLPMPTTAEDWDAVQFTSVTGDEAAVFVFADLVHGGQRTIRLQALQPERKYQITRPLDGAPWTVRGRELMDDGLAIELAPREGVLWRIGTA
ncbi:MAG: alpha-galactosidase [Anaerolineales bacterium]|nr:alpha-galactosidase [Anaerolineales bacterium]